MGRDKMKSASLRSFHEEHTEPLPPVPAAGARTSFESLVREMLDQRGVGVVIEAYHLCMMMRGVEKQNSKTVTSALRGALLQDAKTRDEFLRLVYSRGPG